jgi:hypothetical protein
MSEAPNIRRRAAAGGAWEQRWTRKWQTGTTSESGPARPGPARPGPDHYPSRITTRPGGRDNTPDPLRVRPATARPVSITSA